MVLRGNTSALRGRIFQPGKKADGIPAVFLAGMAFGDSSDQAEGSKGVEAGTAEGAGDICGFLLCNGFSGIGVAGFSLRCRCRGRKPACRREVFFGKLKHGLVKFGIVNARGKADQIIPGKIKDGRTARSAASES